MCIWLSVPRLESVVTKILYIVEDITPPSVLMMRALRGGERIKEGGKREREEKGKREREREERKRAREREKKEG